MSITSEQAPKCGYKVKEKPVSQQPECSMGVTRKEREPVDILRMLPFYDTRFWTN